MDRAQAQDFVDQAYKGCDRCGAGMAAVMELNFSCNRRRCPMRSLLDAKRDCERVARDAAPGNVRAQQEALRTLFACIVSGGDFDVSKGILKS